MVENRNYETLEREFKAKYGDRLLAVLQAIGHEITVSQNAGDLLFLHQYLGEAFRQVHDEICKAKFVIRDDVKPISMN